MKYFGIECKRKFYIDQNSSVEIWFIESRICIYRFSITYLHKWGYHRRKIKEYVSKSE
jgi:hypothetical protein